MSVNIYNKETKSCKEVANKTRTAIIDDAMSDTSDNPVKNKVTKKYVDDVKALRASTDSYGMVKVTNASDVTDSTGIALAATEKNASIEGTLANQVSMLNSNLGQLSNPNLLINPDFRINQRGGKISLLGTATYSDEACTITTGNNQNVSAMKCIKSGNNYKWEDTTYGNIYIKASDVVDGYCENGKYTFDRWNMFIDTEYNNFMVKLSNDGVVLSGYGWFFQPIECKSLLSKKCTLTAHTSIGTLTTTAEFPNTNGSAAGNVDIDQKLNMFLECNSNLPRVVFHCNITEEITIYDVKLELGNIATPFVPPDPATELVKCQRYYKKYTRLPVLRNKQGSEYFGPSAPDIFRMSPDIDGWSSDINNFYTASVLGYPDIEIKIVGRAGNGSLSNGVMLWFRIVNSDGSNIESTVTSLEIFNIALDAEIY